MLRVNEGLLILVNYEECSLLGLAQLLDFANNVKQVIVDFFLQTKNVFHEIKARECAQCIPVCSPAFGSWRCVWQTPC